MDVTPKMFYSTYLDTGDHKSLTWHDRWDRRVDKGSINPGKQIFEKMISGMYMGEVVRQVVGDLVTEGLIFRWQFNL